MADDYFHVTVNGIDESRIALEALVGDLKKKVIRAALKDAAKPIIADARTSTAFRDFGSRRRVAGTLRKNIRVANSKKYKGADGVIGVFVSVKATKKSRRQAPVSGDPFYYRFVEGGHRIVPRRAKGALRLTQSFRRATAKASVAARPFLEPASVRQFPNALRIFQERIAQRIAVANAAKASK